MSESSPYTGASEPSDEAVEDEKRDRCSACGRFLPKTSTYANRCSDCWTPEDDFI
jgi:hypothetical protein